MSSQIAANDPTSCQIVGEVGEVDTFAGLEEEDGR